MGKRVQYFLKKHSLRGSDVDIGNLAGVFMEDMKNGLNGKEGCLRMIPTYIEAENEFLTDVPVLAIDAGGTNFRAAIIRFTGMGQVIYDEIINEKMPGLDKEISADEFFSTIGGYIKPLARATDRIGFCFSYPTEILPNRDGRLIQFCKEVQAPGVVGQLVGKSLLESLDTPGKQIVLLNDTVATLLAGKSASFGKACDSYIGFILGTGTNACYIEQNHNILKSKNLDQHKSQIINIESGNFGKAPRSDLDVIFDNTTADPGSYTFEKMFSGGYFGGLYLTVLKAAAEDGLFSPRARERLGNIVDLSSNDADSFAISPKSGKTILNKTFEDDHDIENACRIFDALIDRAGSLAAANIAAVVLATGKGKNQSKPVLITIEGTTFYKLLNLKARFERHLSDYLAGEKKRYIEYASVRQSSLVGAALAALIN